MNRRVRVISITCLIVSVIVFHVCGACLADTAGDAAQAQSLMSAGQYESALAKYQELIRSNPNAPEVATWYRVMADCYFLTNRPSECFVAMDKAIELVTDPQLKMNYRHVEVSLRMGAQKYEDALAECQSLIKDYPNAAGPYRYMADCYSLTNRPSECLAAIDKAVELVTDPQEKKSYRQVRASFRLGFQKYEDALAEYQSLIKDYPNAAEIGLWYRGMADCYSLTNRPSECLAAIDKAVELVTDPQVKLSYRQVRASLRMGPQKYEDALADYQSLIKDYPNAAETGSWYRYMADCYSLMNRPTECFAALDKAVELATTPAAKSEALFLKAELLIEYRGDYSNATSILEQLIADFPDQRYANLARVQIGTITLWTLWKPTEARTIFTALLTNAGSPGLDEAELLYHLAYCTYVEKNYLGARGEFQSLYDTHPDSGFSESALYMVGDCSVRIGDNDAARNAFNKVISGFPGTDLATRAQERLAALASIKKPKSKPVAGLGDTKVAQLEKQEGHINETK